MTKTHVTLRMIAQELGVHPSTVSLAMRNHRGIPAATREKVQAAAARLGYVPNPRVSAYMQYIRGTARGTPLVPLAFLHLYPQRRGYSREPHARRFFNGAELRASALGFSVDHVWKSPDLSFDQISRILVARGIEGLLIGPNPDAGQTIGLRWEQFSAVAFGFSIRTPALHRAISRQHSAIRLVIDQLAARGYRRVGLAEPFEHDQRVDFAWSSGFLLAQHQERIARDLPMLLPGTLDFPAFRHWFLTHRPEAVISTHALVPEWLGQLHATNPHEPGLASLSVHPDENPHGVCGADQNFEVIGGAAIGILHGLMARNERGLPSHPSVTMIEPAWIDGATVRPPRPPPTARAHRRTPTKPAATNGKPARRRPATRHHSTRE